MSDPTEPVPPTAGLDAAALEAPLPSDAPVASGASPEAVAPLQASYSSEAPVADAPVRPSSLPAPGSVRPSQWPQARPTFLFLGIVAGISL
ncbi:MAG TPA: hypothetical protein VER04_21610, partial [Polyangiaceae bacterium]|nr:hypothetical protein [Polyangiaceae bacterium]